MSIRVGCGQLPPTLHLFFFLRLIASPKFAAEASVSVCYLFVVCFFDFVDYHWFPLFCVHSPCFVFAVLPFVVYCSPRCTLTMFCCKFRFGFTTFVMRPFGWQFGTPYIRCPCCSNSPHLTLPTPSVQLLCICLLFLLRRR